MVVPTGSSNQDDSRCYRWFLKFLVMQIKYTKGYTSYPFKV